MPAKKSARVGLSGKTKPTKPAKKTSVPDEEEEEEEEEEGEAQTNPENSISPASPGSSSGASVVSTAASNTAASRKKREVTAFNEEQKEAIINFLKLHPILYIKHLSGYKDKVKKGRMWQDLASTIDTTPAKCQVWYQSMRTALGKLKRKKASGAATPVYTPTQQWVLDKFAFLQRHISCHKSSTVGFPTLFRPEPTPSQPGTSSQAEAVWQHQRQRTPSAVSTSSHASDPASPQLQVPVPLPVTVPVATPTPSGASGPPSVHSASSNASQPAPVAVEAMPADLRQTILETLSLSKARHPLIPYVESQLLSFPPLIMQEVERGILQAIMDGQRSAARYRLLQEHPSVPVTTIDLLSTAPTVTSVDLAGLAPLTTMDTVTLPTISHPRRVIATSTPVSSAPVSTTLTDTYLPGPSATFVGVQPPVNMMQGVEVCLPQPVDSSIDRFPDSVDTTDSFSELLQRSQFDQSLGSSADDTITNM